jgi:hypothetical protein
MTPMAMAVTGPLTLSLSVRQALPWLLLVLTNQSKPSESDARCGNDRPIGGMMKPNLSFLARVIPPARNRRLRLLQFVLIFCLVIPLLLGASVADADPEPAVPGGFTAISPDGDPAANSAFVANPSAPVAGALIYEDFIKIERKAYALLKPNLEFRESISPYNAKPGYLTLVQKFDYQAGLASTIYTRHSDNSATH